MPSQFTSVGLLAVIFIAAYAPHIYAQDVRVRNQNGLLTVQANNASATQLAEVLSDQLGISVVVTGDTETLVNIDIDEEPLDKALTKLSPNNMLVRAGKEFDSQIIEIVLLMGEGSQNSSTGAGAGQFLPSGSPAEQIVAGSNGNIAQPTDADMLRDPNRAQAVKDAAGAATRDAELPATKQPIDYSSSVPTDPETGLPAPPQ